jgi:hypothetical protein
VDDVASQNRTVTVFRVSATAAGAESMGVAQVEQKREPGRFSAPHEGQGTVAVNPALPR